MKIKEEKINLLKNDLSHFGEVDEIFLGGYGKNWKNAFIKIVTRRDLAELIKKELARNFTLENGYLVNVVLEEGPILDEKRGVYYVYIVPDEELDDKSKEEQTKNCITSMHHLIHNLSQRKKEYLKVNYRTSRKI